MSLMIRVRRLLPLALWAFGLVFCAQWLIGLVAFPFIKERPIGLVPVFVGVAAAVALLMRSRGQFPLRIPWASASDRGFLTALLVVAALLRVAAILVFPLEPLVDDAQFHRYAASMLDEGPYGTPLYRAFFPPGMTLVLYAWYAVWGPGWLIGKLLNAVIGVALVATVFLFTRRHVGARAARLAGLATALMPTLVFYAATLGYEVLLALLWLWWAWLVLVLDRGPVVSPRLILLGLLTGAAALVNPQSLLLPIFAGLVWIRTRHPLDVAVRGLVLVVLTLVVVAPWTYRNYQVFGKFVLISTNGGVTLYSANNEAATGLPMPVTPAPGSVDEVTRDLLMRQKAVAWMRANPLDWGRLAVMKSIYTWGTASSVMSVVSTDRLTARAEQICMAVLNAAWAALAVICAWQVGRHGPWGAGPLAPLVWLVAYVFVVHLFFEALSRHQIPVVPGLLVLAAAGMAGRPGCLEVGGD